MNKRSKKTDPETAFKVVRKPSQADEAVDLIRSKIIDLTLPQGSRIDERLLVEQFKLGRTPAREAINRLQAEGFVNIVPDRGGKFVRDLDMKEIGEVMTAHQVAESMLAALCNLEHPKMVEVLESIQSRYETAVREKDYLAITDLNQDFHLRLHGSIDNSFLMSFAQSTHRHVRRLLVMMYKLEAELPSVHEKQFEANVEQHRSIIDAVRNRDRAALSELLPYHALQTQVRLAAFYEAKSSGALSVNFEGIRK